MAGLFKDVICNTLAFFRIAAYYARSKFVCGLETRTLRTCLLTCI